MEKKIIVGDFSGIQGYLYNIHKNKSATKRLKGRSAFIEMLLEKAKNDLIELFGIKNCENYLISGGKFILTINNFDQSKFDNFKIDLENKLLKQFYGELKIIFGINENGDDFKNSLNKAFENLEKNKNKAFGSIFIKDGNWDSEKFVFNDNRGTDTVCSFSRGDFIDNVIKDDYIDDVINEEKEKNENFNGIGLNTKNDIIISNFIAKNYTGNKEIIIFENEKIKLDEKYKKYLPRFDNEGELKEFNKNKTEKEKAKINDLKSFEALAGKNNFNKLACLKGDIDNLGKLFMSGLDESKYKENYETLSNRLDDFWKNKLYDLIGNKDIYTVYAGGDDFLILGKWDVIIQFYIDLQKEFNAFVNSHEIQDLLKEKTNITFSGAINLFGPHDTFFTVVKQTDNLLDEAKLGEKNNINIFGKVINNDDFKKLFKEIEKLDEKYIKNEVVSIQTLRFLLDTAKKIILTKKDGKDEYGNKREFFEYGLWKAEVFYMLGRNYNFKEEKTEEKILKNTFRNYIDSMIVNNEETIFKSLNGNNDLFNEKQGEKLFVMMSYILYKLRG